MRNAIEGSEVHFGIPGPWRSPPFRFAPSMILPFLLTFTIHLDLFAIPSDQQERFPVFRLSSTFLSVSEQRTHHDDVRAAWLGSAMFTSEGGYVFVDDSTRQAYGALETGRIQPLTDAEPDLPSTLRLIGRLSSGEIVAADDHRGSISAVTADDMTAIGEYDAVRWQPACVFGDGTVVVRPSVRARFGVPQGSKDGIHRYSVEYSAMDRQGIVRPLATVAGDEATWLTTQSNGWQSRRATSVIFGHKTLVACSHNYLVVAQTDLDVVTLVDRDADTVLQFPLPGRRHSVSATQIDAQRRLSTATAGRRSRIERRRYEYMASKTAIRIVHRDLTPDDMAAVPSNDIAPPVDQLFVDASDRIWIRMLPLPNDETIYWHIWSVDQRATSFLFKLPRQANVVDAYDDRVLLRVEEPGRHDRLIVASMIRSPDSGQLPAF